MLARSLRIDFFDEKGVKTQRAGGARGASSASARAHMVARGSVVLLTTEGWRMSTEEMHFLNSHQDHVGQARARREGRHAYSSEGVG